MRRRGSAVLAVVFALAVPGPVLAQSVGDEQYRDPFAGEEPAQDDGGDDTAPSSPAPSPAPAPAPAAPTDSATDPTATTAGTLPRTGAEAAWVAAAGLLLIAGGIGLRRTART